MRTADQEIKLRVPEDVKQLLKDAAVIEDVTLSQFTLETATARAKQVVAEVEIARMTLLPPRFFDELQASLDEPGEVSPALVNAFVVVGARSRPCRGLNILNPLVRSVMYDEEVDDASSFSCGREAFDIWLRSHAARAQLSGTASTYVWVHREHGVIGYRAVGSCARQG